MTTIKEWKLRQIANDMNGGFLERVVSIERETEKAALLKIVWGYTSSLQKTITVWIPKSCIEEIKEFNVGDKVSHPKFGEGVVTDTIGPVLVIDFNGIEKILQEVFLHKNRILNLKEKEKMSIKEARNKIGLSQQKLSDYLNIPKRTIEDWENGKRKAPAWVESLIIEKLERFYIDKFRIYSTAVECYANYCKQFANDTAEWSGLKDCTFYTTSSIGGWEETPDNAHGGIYLEWAFHLSDEEIELRAGEELFKNFSEEIQAAIDNGCELEIFQTIVNKYNFN